MVGGFDRQAVGERRPGGVGGGAEADEVWPKDHRPVEPVLGPMVEGDPGAQRPRSPQPDIDWAA